MAIWPSEEWMALYRDAINASPEYRTAAADWEGAIVYVFDPEPDKGLAGEVWGYFDLWHGECRSARQITPEESADAKFVIRAPYSVWKKVMKKELDPLRAVMQGKLRMKGDMATVMRYMKATQALNEIAAGVPAEFLDELPTETIRELAAQGLPVVVPAGRT